jgi:hypothetical protein
MSASLCALAKPAISAGAVFLVCTCVIAAESAAPGINERYTTEEGRKVSTEIFEAAQAVGSRGKVYAEDPQKEFIQRIEDKIDAADLDNVIPVVGTYVDTKLPDRSCDVAIVLDAYHHFEWPTPMQRI